MVISLSLVMVESRYTFHIVPSVKFLCEIFKHLLRLMGGLNFGQGDDKLPCFNTLSCGAASFKFLLTFLCEITPKGIVCGSVGGIGVLLSCVACNIRYSSLDIGQLRHLNEAVSCHSLLSAVLGCSHFVTDLSVATVPVAFDRGTATENCDVIFSVSTEGLECPILIQDPLQGRNIRSTNLQICARGVFRFQTSRAPRTVYSTFRTSS